MRSWPLLLIFTLLPPRAWADKILLKNGQALKGIIQSEDATKLMLDFGYGTTILQKTEIQSIHRSSAKERQALKHRFLGQAAKAGALKTPPGAKELARLLEATRRAREAAQDARREREQLLGEQEELAEQMRELKRRQPAIASALSSASPEQSGYNSLVGDLNALNAQLQADYLRSEEADRKLAAGEAEVGKYLSDYGALRRYAAANLKHLRAGAVDESAKVFYKDAAREIEDMARDFKKDAVPSRRIGEHLVVDVLFNGKVTAPLMVDTGASDTMISPKVAVALGLEGGEPVRATLADGKQVMGRLVVLDSVAVADSRVEKSPAIVLAAPEPHVEGLLGMSFLKNFMVQLDLPNSKLILEGLALPVRPKP